MILSICTEREVKYFRQMYLPVREPTCLIGSGGHDTLDTWDTYDTYDTRVIHT